MIGPCCFGIPLKRGVKFIALFEMSINIITAISTVLILGSMWTERKSSQIQPNAFNNTSKNGNSSQVESASGSRFQINTEVELGEPQTLQEPPLIFLLLLLIGQIALSWILYKGASKEKFRHLRTWWWIKLCLMVIFLIFDMVDVFTGENRKLEYIICLQVFYQGYVLWIVKSLIDEIRGIGPPRFTPLTTPSAGIEIEEDV